MLIKLKYFVGHAPLARGNFALSDFDKKKKKHDIIFWSIYRARDGLAAWCNGILKIASSSDHGSKKQLVNLFTLRSNRGFALTDLSYIYCYKFFSSMHSPTPKFNTGLNSIPKRKVFRECIVATISIIGHQRSRRASIAMEESTFIASTLLCEPS